MPLLPDDPLFFDFCQSLSDCQRLYREAARHCVRSHPHLIRQSPEEYLEFMEDLHRGVVVKAYMETALIDQRWSNSERELARVLVEHAWHQTLDDDELRQAAQRLSRDIGKVSWYTLVRPFVDRSPLHERAAELESIILRIANIVAKCDGQVVATEKRYLHSLQEELERHLRPLSLDDAGETDAMGEHPIRTSMPTMQESSKQVDASPQPSAGLSGSIEKPSLEELLSELDGLIGLGRVKDEVRTLANFLKFQKSRAESNLPTTEMTLHMVFAGNPGTGKTTVARLVSQIFQAMGILTKGHLVETDRSGMVAEYAGQTGPKTNKRIDEALDGVLFIDEAYSLVADEGDDAYGREALQSLLKRMEDDRQRLVVILAGYPEPMERLLRANPGLSSRFSRTLQFDDYTPQELCRIFARLCEINHYEIPAEVRARLLIGFTYLFERRDEHFGNGRLVRNVFENAVRQLANRIANESAITHEMLTRFTPVDLRLSDVPASYSEMPLSSLEFQFMCPGCREMRAGPYTILGQQVRCAKCNSEFLADWGEWTRRSGGP
ncbi:MAG: AAA family ATPase [Planctomycetales bacterium]|nr:AAA family ATPase [Planctomycetales bacterium]